MILSAAILFAALRCDPSVMSVYALPPGAVTSQIAPSSVPGAVPAEDAAKRLSGATFSAMYGLREALFQRWLVSRLNATYGGAASANWSELPAVDFMPTNGTASASNGYWFDPQPFVLEDEAVAHAKRNVASPRISAKIVEPADALCDAIKQNSPVSGLVPQVDSSYESPGNDKVRTWLDPSVDHIALVRGGEWQMNGDDTLADVDSGFLRAIHESPNDIASADTCGLFGSAVKPTSLRGRYVTSKMEDGGLSGSMLEKFYTDAGLHRQPGMNVSAFLSALAPGLPSNAVAQTAIANAKSRRIDWSRFALANAVTSLASTYFVSDIANSRGMYNEGVFVKDAVGNLWRGPGGLQCVAVVEDVVVDATSETSYELGETTDEDDDSKILIAAVESPDGSRALAYLFDTSNLVDSVKSHVVTNSGSEVYTSTNAVNQSCNFYYKDGYGGGPTNEMFIAISAGLLVDFYPNALVESAADGECFKFVQTTLEKIPPGVYPADNFRVGTSWKIVGDAVIRDQLFVYTFPPDSSTSPVIPEDAQNLPLFELNPMRSTRKIHVHVMRNAAGSGVRPAAEQPLVVPAAEWQDDSTRMRAPGVLPTGCPLASCLDRAAVFNFSTVFVSFMTAEDIEGGKFMTFVDKSNPSFAYSRLRAENAAPCDADALQASCEKPWLTLREDMAEREADALSRVDYTVVRDGVRVNLAEMTPSLFDDDRLNLGRASDRTTEMTNVAPSVSKALPSDKFPVSGLALLVEDTPSTDADGNVSTVRTASWISDQLDSHDSYQPCTQMWCRVSLADYVVAATNLPPRRTAVMQYDNFSSLYMKFKFPAMGDETFTTKED